MKKTEATRSGRAPKPLLIGELARQAGVKPDTIRFYERQGLLPKPARTAAGYRVYAGDALRQIGFIKQAQSLGFTLDEIQRILNLRGKGKERCRCVINIAEATLEEIEKKLAELNRFRDALKENLPVWKKEVAANRRMPEEFCALIEAGAKPVARPWKGS
jgi:DNA-binding transcriptional MerR regulator